MPLRSSIILYATEFGLVFDIWHTLVVRHYLGNPKLVCYRDVLNRKYLDTFRTIKSTVLAQNASGGAVEI